MNELFAKSVPLLPPKQIEYTFITPPFIMAKNHINSVKEIIETINRIIGEKTLKFIIHQIQRLDGVFRISSAEGIVMCWSILEKLLNCNGMLLSYALPWFYQVPEIKLNRREELKFWNNVRSIRNDFIHGTFSISKYRGTKIKNFLKQYSIDQKSLAFIVRERMFRIFLFCILSYHQSSSKKNRLEYRKFISDLKDMKLMGDQNLKMHNIIGFKEIIQFKTDNELGLLKKYKAESKMRIVDI